jgi:hypothetical protein
MKSINPSMIPIACLVFSALLAATGQILLKIGATGSRELIDFLNMRVLFDLDFMHFPQRFGFKRIAFHGDGRLSGIKPELSDGIK